jgi:DNA-directed RNA polymerase specialized sigma24 family protein
MSNNGSVTRWISELKHGDSQAVEKLWNRYFEQLVGLARTQLSNMPRRAVDEEDVALSAFNLFFRAVKEGRFPRLADRNDLWQLLFHITDHKAIDQIRHEGRKKRGGGHVRGESAFSADVTENTPGIDQVVGENPTPEFAAIVAEECQRLLRQLDDDLLPVAVAKMENYTNKEIAEILDCSVATVERSLRLIRKIWQTEKE